MKKTSKRFSRVLGLVLVFAMMFSVGSVYAGDGDVANTPLEQLRAELLQEYPALVEAEAINKTIDSFMNQPAFDDFYFADPVGAIENVRIAAMGAMSDTKIPYWMSNGIYGASAPTIHQYLYYYCGPTAALQVLTGQGRDSSIPGSTVNAKQDSLASNMGTTTGGTQVYRVVNGINMYSSSTYYYSTPSSLADFESQIKASLFWDKPVILSTQTAHLGYYNDHASEHYIVLKGYNMNTGKVVLADCNYSYQYYGEHTVTLQEAFNSIAGRWIIRGYEGYA